MKQHRIHGESFGWLCLSPQPFHYVLLTLWSLDCDHKRCNQRPFGCGDHCCVCWRWTRGLGPCSGASRCLCSVVCPPVGGQCVECLKEQGRLWEGKPRGKSRNICLPFTMREETTSHIVSSVPVLLDWASDRGSCESRLCHALTGWPWAGHIIPPLPPERVIVPALPGSWSAC